MLEDEPVLSLDSSFVSVEEGQELSIWGLVFFLIVFLLGIVFAGLIFFGFLSLGQVLFWGFHLYSKVTVFFLVPVDVDGDVVVP